MTLHAVSSLKRLLEKYLIEDDPSSGAMLEFAYKQVKTAEVFSKRVMFRSNAIRRPAVDIYDAIRRLRGALKSESRSQGIHNLEKEIHFFTQTMHKLEEDEDIVERLNESLKGKRYLIVLDDVWDKYTAKFLKYPVYRGNLLRYHFPNEGLGNESRILVISRMQQVDEFYTFQGGIRGMRLMNEEESWHLLHEIVFAQESCPFNLERIGKKIAEKCEGLPLTIVTVANLLSKHDKTAEYWNEVATQKRHQLFKLHMMK